MVQCPHCEMPATCAQGNGCEMTCDCCKLPIKTGQNMLSCRRCDWDAHDECYTQCYSEMQCHEELTLGQRDVEYQAEARSHSPFRVRRLCVRRSCLTSVRLLTSISLIQNHYGTTNIEGGVHRHEEPTLGQPNDIEYPYDLSSYQNECPNTTRNYWD